MKGRALVVLLVCGASVVVSMSIGAARQAAVRDRAQAAAVQQKEMAKRGEALFSRHCAICHLGRPAESRPYIGRNLRGILKNREPKQEARVREFIAKGTDRMPGFQYNLTAAQIDDLVSYLITYN